MPSRKHLVLDQDVHEALSQRREMTGVPIGQLGNKILRSHILSSLCERLMGEELVQRGHVSWEEYESILESVDRRARSRRSIGPAPVERVGEREFIAGSWEIHNLFESPVGAFQLLESWARDPHMHPLSQHAHAGEQYVVVLEGRCIVVMKGIPSILTKDCVLRVPSGVTHSATPLDADSHLLIVMVPGAPEYSPGKVRRSPVIHRERPDARSCPAREERTCDAVDGKGLRSMGLVRLISREGGETGRACGAYSLHSRLDLPIGHRPAVRGSESR